MKEFTVIDYYDKGDIEMYGDVLETRLFDEDNNLITCGDEYHDKISDEIEGFFKCLDYLGIDYIVKQFSTNIR